MDDEVRIIQCSVDSEQRLLRMMLSDGAILEMAPDAPEAGGFEPGDLVDADSRAALELAAARRDVARDVLRLLGRRVYTRAQLAEKLRAKGRDQRAVEPVLDQCQQQGLLDDAQYARSFCRDQLRQRPVGRNWLRQKLRVAGVAEHLVEQALDETADAEGETLRARRAVAAKSRDLHDEAGKARAFRFLVGRGFSKSVARRTVFDLADELRAAAGESYRSDVD